jgi:glycosyltransferase involved in cell wall biosynthesis
MRVGLVTPWQTRCGLAEYAKNLVECSQGIDFKIVTWPLSFQHIVEETEDVDIIHFNYSSGWFNDIGLDEWQKFRDRGQPNILTFHDSSEEMVKKVVKLGLFDRIVVHTGTWNPYPKSVRWIFQPIKNVDTTGIPVHSKIGTAGFPFPWKGFPKVAHAANQLGVKYFAIMSESDQVDAYQMKKVVTDICPNSEVVVGWLEYETIVKRLAQCAMNVFAYDLSYQQLPMNGISAGVRFGLAARRPVIVSKCKMFEDLLDYPDEVYVAGDVLGETIIQVFKDIADGCVKLPNHFLEERSWEKGAEKYKNVYEELYDTESNDARRRLSRAGA